MPRTLALAAALLALCLCAGGADAVPAVEDGNHSVTLVTEDVSNPTALAFIGADDFLVLEKNTGRVQRFAAGVRTQVLDLHVSYADERGLLGIAVHPGFGLGMGKDWVYLYYTTSPAMADIDDNTVAAPNQLDRFDWNGTQLVNRTPLLTLPGDVAIHNGGTLAFGPDDGKLYGVIGDNNRYGQLQNVELGDPPDDTGMIFRVNDDGTLPLDNPLDADNDGTDPEDILYAYGVRNSFGLAFDPQSGSLWDTENGPTEWDEVNLVAPGFNSGWRDEMGPAATLPPPGLFVLPGSSYADPAYSIQDTVAVTGLAFASDDSSLGTEYVGDLLVADANLGQIYRFELNPGRSALDLGDVVAQNQGELNQHLFASGFGAVTDLKEGPDGALYVAAYGLDAIYKIEGGGGPGMHDLAVASVKAPKRVTLSAAKPVVTGGVAVTIVNQGSHVETIQDATELGQLVTLDVTPLTVGCPDAPLTTLAPPKQGFPLPLAPRKKLKLVFQLAFDCATEATAEYEYDVTLDHSVLGGDADDDPGDDVCPRAASVDDKGCGKPAGSPIRTDVIEK